MDVLFVIFSVAKCRLNLHQHEKISLWLTVYLDYIIEPNFKFYKFIFREIWPSFILIRGTLSIRHHIQNMYMQNNINNANFISVFGSQNLFSTPGMVQTQITLL